MKKRFCDVCRVLGACDAGWGSIGDEGLHSCYDKPMEGNCRNIVDVPEDRSDIEILSGVYDD